MLKSEANFHLWLSYKTIVNSTDAQQVNSTFDSQTHYMNSASTDFKPQNMLHFSNTAY